MFLSQRLMFLCDLRALSGSCIRKPDSAARSQRIGRKQDAVLLSTPLKLALMGQCPGLRPGQCPISANLRGLGFEACPPFLKPVCGSPDAQSRQLGFTIPSSLPTNRSERYPGAGGFCPGAVVPPAQVSCHPHLAPLSTLLSNTVKPFLRWASLGNHCRHHRMRPRFAKTRSEYDLRFTWTSEQPRRCDRRDLESQCRNNQG